MMEPVVAQETALAMHSCIEGYQAEVVDSIAFSLNRDLTEEKVKAVCDAVTAGVSKAAHHVQFEY